MWTKLTLSIIAISLLSCQSHESGTAADKAIKKVVKPKSKVYQPSELALEMRTIYGKLKIIGSELKNGEPVTDSLLLGYEKILEAKGSEPSDTDESFMAFANQWLNTVNAFKENSSQENYNRVMDGCIACHEQRCPGPIPKIKRLKL